MHPSNCTGTTYLHRRFQLALESEIDQVWLQAQPVVDGVNISGQPYEGPPFRHGFYILAGCANEDGAVYHSEFDCSRAEQNRAGEQDLITGSSDSSFNECQRNPTAHIQQHKIV